MSDVITAFLMDDHEVVRQGVRALLEATGEIRVVGEASTAAEALSRIPAVRPDVAILDVRVPDGNGIEVCREVRSRVGTHCLMLTSYSDDEALFEAIMAGASGYVLKRVVTEDLVRAIHEVYAGESFLYPPIAATLIGDYLRVTKGSRGEGPREPLTAREREVIRLLAQGASTKVVAAKLSITHRTARNHIQNLLGRLGAHSRLEAVARARATGLI